MKRYEYMVYHSVEAHHKKRRQELNMLGEYGWELVSTLRLDNDDGYEFYLKRDVPN